MTFANIDTDQRNGNLHIKVEGLFTSNVAAQLSVVMEKLYVGRGNIFIHTKAITEVTANAQAAFSSFLKDTGLPKENVYLTGEKGRHISPDSGKVIVYKRKKHGHGGCGKCRNCTCNKKKAA